MDKDNINSDHRSRLRDRFDLSGLSAFSEHEILEYVLMLAIPRIDTKPLAKELLKKHGDLPGVFSVDRKGLEQTKGIGPSASRVICFLRELSQLIVKKKAFGEKKLVRDAKDVVEYLTAVMSNLNEEEFRVIYLDHSNRIIGDEIISRGVEEQTAVYPRKIIRHALLNHATGLIISHNHPTGSIKPSTADKMVTEAISDATKAVEIRLLDHIIIGRESAGYFSFRENGML
ncbi:MAG: DNA repair protein RadC [Candidatus Riflebacteria bacterium]|nr:DNA repair protein RadC [Candidatus Riflebacteria bacterium]